MGLHFEGALSAGAEAVGYSASDSTRGHLCSSMAYQIDLGLVVVGSPLVKGSSGV